MQGFFCHRTSLLFFLLCLFGTWSEIILFALLFSHYDKLVFSVCQEPLRSSISSQLRNSVQGFSLTSEILEHAVQLVTNDNLDLGCAVIEQAATDKVPVLALIYTYFINHFLVWGCFYSWVMWHAYNLYIMSILVNEFGSPPFVVLMSRSQ